MFLIHFKTDSSECYEHCYGFELVYGAPNEDPFIEGFTYDLNHSMIINQDFDSYSNYDYYYYYDAYGSDDSSSTIDPFDYSQVPIRQAVHIKRAG